MKHVIKSTLIKRSIFPDQVLGLLLIIIFAGAVLLETSVHRIVLYITFVTGFYFFKKHTNLKGLFSAPDFPTRAGLTFLVFSAFSFLWSSNLSFETALSSVKPAIFIILCCCAYRIFIFKNIFSHKYFIKAFMLTATMSGITLLLINFHDIYEYYTRTSNTWRLQGFGRVHNSNLAGLIYGSAFLIALFYKNSTYKTLSKLIWIVTTGFLGLTAFLTLSRGALISVFITFFLIGILKFFTKSLQASHAIYSVIAVFSLMIGFCFFMPDILEYMIERGSTGRLSIWQQAFSYFLEAPILGHGIGEKLTYSIMLNNEIYSFNHTHNIYLGTLVHTGLIGIILFLAFAVSLWAAAFDFAKNNKDYSYLILISMGLIFGFFDMGGFYRNLNIGWIVFWIPGSITLALKHKIRLQDEL